MSQNPSQFETAENLPLKRGDIVRVVRDTCVHNDPGRIQIGDFYEVADDAPIGRSVQLVDAREGRAFSGGGWGRDRFALVSRHGDQGRPPPRPFAVDDRVSHLAGPPRFVRAVHVAFVWLSPVHNGGGIGLIARLDELKHV